MMIKLHELLNDYKSRRLYKSSDEQRFVFENPEERSFFLRRLIDARATYFLYESAGQYKVEVFLE